MHWLFDTVVSVYTLLASINAIILLFHGIELMRIFDSIFVFLFLAELIVRLVAIGP
jgi:hypothetical protein